MELFRATNANIYLGDKNIVIIPALVIFRYSDDGFISIRAEHDFDMDVGANPAIYMKESFASKKMFVEIERTSEIFMILMSKLYDDTNYYNGEYIYNLSFRKPDYSLFGRKDFKEIEQNILSMRKITKTRFRVGINLRIGVNKEMLRKFVKYSIFNGAEFITN